MALRIDTAQKVLTRFTRKIPSDVMMEPLNILVLMHTTGWVSNSLCFIVDINWSWTCDYVEILACLHVKTVHNYSDITPITVNGAYSQISLDRIAVLFISLGWIPKKGYTEINLYIYP